MIANFLLPFFATKLANRSESHIAGQRHRAFSADQKVAIVRRHLVDGVAVSDLCDEYKIQPTQFYQWQKLLFENGAAAFEPQPVSSMRGYLQQSCQTITIGATVKTHQANQARRPFSSHFTNQANDIQPMTKLASPPAANA
jgi:transposase